MVSHSLIVAGNFKRVVSFSKPNNAAIGWREALSSWKCGQDWVV